MKSRKQTHWRGGNDFFLKKNTILRGILVAWLRAQKSENVMINTLSKTLLVPSGAHASSDSLGFWQCILGVRLEQVFFSNLIPCTQIRSINTESILHGNYEVQCCPKVDVIFLKFPNLGLYNWQEAISVFFSKHETSCLTHHA